MNAVSPTPKRGDADAQYRFAHSSFAGFIGAAREDITPPVGIYSRNWGAARHDAATGIHRPLTLTALALRAQPAGAPLVLIALDLGWWKTPGDEWLLRGALLDALRLDPARLLLNLSHTHAGPGLCAEDRALPGGEMIEPYVARVKEAAVRAARSALDSCRPATLSWNYGRCALACDRDLPDPARPRVICGFNPRVQADDTVLVGRVADDSGRILATIVNYACHPVTLAWDNTLISPDYIGAMRDVVEGNTSGAPCLFLQGASGELAPREEYLGDTAVADSHGRQLGFAALAALEGMLPAGQALVFSGVQESGAPLALWTRMAQSAENALEAAHSSVMLPLKELPSVAEIRKQLAGCADRVMAERLSRKLRVRLAVGDGTSARTEFWAWRVGDALLFAQPNEAYSCFQKALRAEFPRRAVAVLNLTNGAMGYLPPAELYEKDIYQVWQTPFASGSLERVLAAGVDSGRELLQAKPLSPAVLPVRR